MVNCSIHFGTGQITFRIRRVHLLPLLIIVIIGVGLFNIFALVGSFFIVIMVVVVLFGFFSHHQWFGLWNAANKDGTEKVKAGCNNAVLRTFAHVTCHPRDGTVIAFVNDKGQRLGNGGGRQRKGGNDIDATNIAAEHLKERQTERTHCQDGGNDRTRFYVFVETVVGFPRRAATRVTPPPLHGGIVVEENATLVALATRQGSSYDEFAGHGGHDGKEYSQSTDDQEKDSSQGLVWHDMAWHGMAWVWKEKNRG